MRRFLLVGAAVALIGAPPAWAAEITLIADHTVARYGESVRFAGTLPVPDATEVQLVRDGVVVAGTVAAEGAFAIDLRATRGGTYVLRTPLGDSAAVAVRVQPLLRSRIVGKRRLGHDIVLTGRLLPAGAGRLLLGDRRIRVGHDGRFRVRLETDRPRLDERLRVRPGTAYVRVARRVRLRLAQPALKLGSHGPSVLALKRRLSSLRFALPAVDAGFGRGTHEAVIAFQKVHGLARTGRVDRAFWRLLWRAASPRPRVRRGDYIEVSKSRQTLYEVRRGKVVNVVHVSTGATGNTPVGTWRVYREVWGWDWILYHPMYFLRGFAIHGYPSVPTWPASHGCVRVPLWIANALRERWGRGAVIRVYA